MIAVVMKSRSTHYVDTKAMLDYGFELAKAGALETNQTGDRMQVLPRQEREAAVPELVPAHREQPVLPKVQEHQE